jgi:hypothetical protein
MDKRNKTLWIILGLVALAAFGAVAWYLASPLFINRSVEEAFPFEMPSQEDIAQMSASEKEKLESDFEAALPNEDELADMPPGVRQAVEDRAMEVAAAMPEQQMEEAMPSSGQPQLLAQGQFIGADSFHMGSGDARIYALADGNLILRLENFSVTNGPDLHVLLAENPSPQDSDSLGVYLDLGSLKGNLGNQNYDIPAGTDINQFKSVVIYCLPFHVVFSTADLAGE